MIVITTSGHRSSVEITALAAFRADVPSVYRTPVILLFQTQRFITRRLSDRTLLTDAYNISVQIPGNTKIPTACTSSINFNFTLLRHSTTSIPAYSSSLGGSNNRNGLLAGVPALTRSLRNDLLDLSHLRGDPISSGNTSLVCQPGRAGKVSVDFLGGLSTFFDTPNNERLASATISSGEDTWYSGGVFLEIS